MGCNVTCFGFTFKLCILDWFDTYSFLNHAHNTHYYSAGIVMNLVLYKHLAKIYSSIIKINSGCVKCKNASLLAVNPIDLLLVHGIILFLCNTFSVGWQRNIDLFCVYVIYS